MTLDDLERPKRHSCRNKTRSSPTAERQRVSYARLSRLAQWSCSSLNSACVLQYCTTIGYIIHCVSKKVHPYDFHDNNVKWQPIQIIFGTHVADEICNKTIWNKCQICSLSIATLSFKMRFNFFNATMERWNTALQKAFVVAIGLWVAFAKTCIMLLAWHIFANVMVEYYYFYLFSNLFKSTST